MSLTVVVTGGSGRIGRFVVRHLVSRGHQVINLDRRQSPDGLARFAYVDLADRAQVQPWLAQADAVIQLGEITHQSAPFSPDHIYAHNTRAAAVVMQTAADLKLRCAIYTSSCQVYGCWDYPIVAPQHLPFDETHPLRPQNVYALSKTANEHYCQWLSKASALSIAIFRLPWVVDHELGDHHWRWIASGRDGFDGLGTYVHASDVAVAYAQAIENPRPGCEAYHLVAPDTADLVPIAEHMKSLKDWPPLPPNWPPFKSLVVTDKARAHLGWEAKWSIHNQYRAKFGKEPGT
jgi:nucleoside-diphosphate-sugar epimerase